MVPPDSHRVSRAPRYSGYHYQLYRLTRTGLSPPMVQLSNWFQFINTSNNVVLQPQHCRNNTGLGFSDFARHYSRNHSCFLLLRLLRCFSSPGWLHIRFSVFNGKGFPIRIPADQFVFADPRSFSQLITSFFASESLGIPHTLLLTSFTNFQVFQRKLKPSNISNRSDIPSNFIFHLPTLPFLHFYLCARFYTYETLRLHTYFTTLSTICQ